MCIGCTGSTRLLGAGKVTKKEFSEFGPKPGQSSTRLKKSAEETLSPSESKQQFLYEDRRHPQVPSKTERPVLGIKSTKNFITANAVEAILRGEIRRIKFMIVSVYPIIRCIFAVPRTVERTELNYLKKEDYGKHPAYLSQVKEDIRRESEMIQKYVKEQLGEVEAEPEQFEEMSEDERQELVYALKAKWDHVNSQYQKITHLVRLDTTGQLRRKEALESQLKNLEADIERLQRSGPVLVRA